ncbi:MAG: methyltransferase family protein [Methylocystis sp.]|uniref:methyltransferase family protein n=1 Tax=Methylocystis sp. TaxID=1911079 RepID=UPI003DA63CFB
MRARIGLSPRTLDQLERYAFLVAYSVFAIQLVGAFIIEGRLTQLLYLMDQSVVLSFFIFRRPTEEISLQRGDWLAGVIGTLLPLLIGPVSTDSAIAPLTATICLGLGISLHLSAKLALGTSIGVIAANRGLKTGGPYRIIRHPMYAGYMVAQLGILLAGPNMRNCVVVVLCWIFFIWRISAEEKLLSRDENYVRFQRRTRARLFPGIY